MSLFGYLAVSSLCGILVRIHGKTQRFFDPRAQKIDKSFFQAGFLSESEVLASLPA